LRYFLVSLNDTAGVTGVTCREPPIGIEPVEFGGWFWRYDLTPLGPSETEVTLTYDWSAVPLHHLAELAAPTSRA
jgi:hypothetical protein